MATHVKYYKDFNQYNNSHSHKDSNLNIMYLNARSIRNKMDDIEILLHTVPEIDIVAVCETWLDKSEELYFNLPNYSAVYSSREKDGGGAGLYIKDGLEYTNVDVIEERTSILTVKLLQTNVTIVLVYKPPKENEENFINLIDGTLSKHCIGNVKVILLGDFNIHYDQRGINFNQFFETCSNHSLEICNTTVPTRVTKTSSSIIDHFFTR